MKTKNNDVELLIDRARWWAVVNMPWYGVLASNLTDAIDADPRVVTAATDGKRILWNSDFVKRLSDEELRFVILHETLHCAHQHLWRLPRTTAGNEAGDYAINGLLRNCDGLSMPADGLYNPAFDGLAEEEILARLPDHHKGGGNPSETGDSCGSFTDPAPDGKSGKSDDGGVSLSDKWERAVIQAAQAAKALGQGNLPSDLKGVLDRALATRIDWRDALADFVKTAVAERNDWSRSARRHALASCIYPRRRRDGFGTIIFARDTSGSIASHPELLAEFSATIDAALAEVGCEGVVIDCDAAIQGEYEVGAQVVCPKTYQGGGGTSFVPVFERAEELMESDERHIAGIVYLTDLEGTFPASKDIPTLWIDYSKRGHSVPFGNVVRV